RAEFRAMYEPFRGRLDPEFVLLARDARGLAAYQFAFPDPSSARGGGPTRLVVKTVATSPRARGPGPANPMLDRPRARAHARGAPRGTGDRASGSRAALHPHVARSLRGLARDPAPRRGRGVRGRLGGPAAARRRRAGGAAAGLPRHAEGPSAAPRESRAAGDPA